MVRIRLVLTVMVLMVLAVVAAVKPDRLQDEDKPSEQNSRRRAITVVERADNSGSDV